MRFLRLEETRPLASVVAVAVWLMGILAALRSDDRLAGASMFLVLPLLALLLSVPLAYIAFRAGRVSALFCAVAAVCLWGARTGPYAGLMAALILLPVPVYSMYSYDCKAPFWPSVGVCAGMLLIAGIAALIAANALTGGDVVAALRDYVEALLRTEPDADRVLLWLAGAGIVQMPEAAVSGIQLGNIILLPATVREELIKQALFTVEGYMRQSLPSQILQGAMLGGVLSVAWPRRVAARRATEMELAPRAPFHLWHIPKALSKPLMLTLLGAWLLASWSESLTSLFRLIWVGASLLFSLQGGAFLAFMMRKGGARPVVRGGAVCLLFLLFPFVLLIMGCADQLFNPRKLRGASQEKRDEEDGK